jgi:hypothetical protein
MFEIRRSRRTASHRAWAYARSHQRELPRCPTHQMKTFNDLLAFYKIKTIDQKAFQEP